MRRYLLLGIGLALASCAAQRALPQYTPEQQASQRESIGFWQPDSAKAIPKLSPAAQRKLDARRRRGQAPTPLASDGGPRALDSVVAVPFATPQPGRSTSFWQKVNPFRSKQPTASTPLSSGGGVGGGVPRKCKGCQITIQNGTGNSSIQTATDKKGQTLGAGASNAQLGKKSGDNIKADSGATVYKATTKKGQAAAGEGISQQHEEVKPGPWPAIIGGLGLLSGVGLVYWLVAGGGLGLLAALWRKNKPTENQA